MITIKYSKKNAETTIHSDFKWIIRVIRSCKTFQQIRTPITNLIELFNKKHADVDLVEILYTTRNKQQYLIKHIK